MEVKDTGAAGEANEMLVTFERQKLFYAKQGNGQIF